jgi:peptidoglycan-N-acetylglucosamine deacetylase
MLIKVPSLALAAALLCSGWGPWAWAGALLSLVVGAGVLLWLVFDPNAAFWAPTRSRAAGDEQAVALTFDDGPDPTFTPRVLEILREKGVPAAFFVVGERVEQHPELVARIDREGHLVGNHSHRHGLDFHFRLWAAARRELAACDEAIGRAIGRRPALFRSPQGFKNPALGDVIRERGLLAVGWQARGFDARSGDAAEIERRVLAQVRPGGIILLHDGAGLHGTLDRSPTLEALPRIIDALRGRGLSIVRLDELLGVEGYRGGGAVEGRAA